MAHFPDNIFKYIFLNENVSISVKILWKFVPRGLINNIPALVQIMAWRQSGDKPSSEPMMVSLLTHVSFGLNELICHLISKRNTFVKITQSHNVLISKRNPFVKITQSHDRLFSNFFYLFYLILFYFLSYLFHFILFYLFYFILFDVQVRQYSYIENGPIWNLSDMVLCGTNIKSVKCPKVCQEVVL